MSEPGGPAERPSDRYFDGERSDLLDWLGTGAGRVLEIGCGAGGNATWLRSRGASRLVGIDLDASSIRAASDRLDLAIYGDVATVLPTLNEVFDLVICADVLEHLPDPWLVLGMLRERLADGGLVVASIPNVRHYRSLVRIAFGRGFTPEPEGVFDATHLRFFTRQNIDQLFRRCGLRPVRWGTSPPRRLLTIRRFVNRGLLADYLTYQWFVAAERADRPSPPSPVSLRGPWT